MPNAALWPSSELTALIGATDASELERARRNLQAMAAEGFLDTDGGIVALASGREDAETGTVSDALA